MKPRDSKGMIMYCLSCMANGLIVPINNQSSRTKQKTYCLKCSQMRKAESMRRAKQRQSFLK